MQRDPLRRSVTATDWAADGPALTQAEADFVSGAMGAPVTTVANAQPIATNQNTGAVCPLVVEGCLVCFRTLKDGFRQIIGFHVAGDLCGLWSPGEFTYAALGEAAVLSISEALIAGGLSASPAIAQAVSRQTRLDNAIIGERVVSMGRRSARGRVAHLICEMEARLVANGTSRGGRFHLKIKQADVADATGLSLVHVNKTLKRLRADELLTCNGGLFSILDKPRLWNEAEFDPAYLRCDDISFGAFLYDLEQRAATNSAGLTQGQSMGTDGREASDVLGWNARPRPDYLPPETTVLAALQK